VSGLSPVGRQPSFGHMEVCSPSLGISVFLFPSPFHMWLAYRLVYYIRDLIVEANREYPFIFVTLYDFPFTSSTFSPVQKGLWFVHSDNHCSALVMSLVLLCPSSLSKCSSASLHFVTGWLTVLLLLLQILALDGFLAGSSGSVRISTLRRRGGCCRKYRLQRRILNLP